MTFYRCCGVAGLALALTGLAARGLEAADSDKLAEADWDKGYTTVIPPRFTGEELRSQDDLWALEVALRPMRMAFVQAVNPKTGAKSSETIWYLVFKVVNRPVPKPVQPSDSLPVNVQDPPAPPICVPRATLVIEDSDIRGAVADSIVPEALAVIKHQEGFDRPNREGKVQPLKTAVQLAGPLPKQTAADSKQPAEYGVFMFRGVDPRTTSFSVYLSGFSNAYKIGKDESGKTIVLRRTIFIPYRRFADKYDQFAKEIRQTGGEAKWVYVPDEAASPKK